MPNLCHCDLKIFKSSDGIPALFFLTCKYWSTTCRFIISLTAWQEDPISQEGRQGMLFIVSSSLSGTALSFVCFPNSLSETVSTSQDQGGYIQKPTCLWGPRAWVSADIPFPNTHLALKLVCVEGPVQIHGFCSWGHFASNTVHIVIVVDSLGVERWGELSQTVRVLLERHGANRVHHLFKGHERANLASFVQCYKCEPQPPPSLLGP